jgi:hypothetical protein
MARWEGRWREAAAHALSGHAELGSASNLEIARRAADWSLKQVQGDG